MPRSRNARENPAAPAVFDHGATPPPPVPTPGRSRPRCLARASQKQLRDAIEQRRVKTRRWTTLFVVSPAVSLARERRQAEGGLEEFFPCLIWNPCGTDPRCVKITATLDRRAFASQRMPFVGWQLSSERTDTRRKPPPFSPASISQHRRRIHRAKLPLNCPIGSRRSVASSTCQEPGGQTRPPRRRGGTTRSPRGQNARFPEHDARHRRGLDETAGHR